MVLKSCEIDSLIAKLSSFGTYQKWQFLLISLAVIFSCVQYSYVFSTRSTKHRCLIEECETNSSSSNYDQPWLKDAIPFDGRTLRKCERYSINEGIKINGTKGLCGSEFFNKSQIIKCEKLFLDLEMTTIEHDFNLTCEENLWKLTIMGSLDEIGEVVFSPFVGYFSDRFGRKWVLINSLVLSGILGVVKSLSSTYLMFAFMEFATACFTSAIYGSVYILSVELLVPKQRVLGSTITAIAFPFGEIMLGVAAWFSPSWRMMLQVLYAPGILFISYYWLIDDSLCYLMASGKVKKASLVIRKIANSNTIVLPDDLETNLENTLQGDKGITLDKHNKVQNESVCQIFKYPSLILRVLNCSFTWISCTFVYYGLTVYSVSLTGNIYLNFIIMAVIELPAYIICYYILDRLGRRYTLVGSLLIGGAACLACAFVPKEIWLAQLLLPMTGKFASTMAFKVIYIYTAEMFPTTLRHTLLAFCSMFGRAGSIAAPQLPILATISPVLPPILFGILGLLAGFFAFFLPETTGCKLPDTLEKSVNIGQQNKSN